MVDVMDHAVSKSWKSVWRKPITFSSFCQTVRQGNAFWATIYIIAGAIQTINRTLAIFICLLTHQSKEIYGHFAGRMSGLFACRRTTAIIVKSIQTSNYSLSRLQSSYNAAHCSLHDKPKQSNRRSIQSIYMQHVCCSLLNSAVCAASAHSSLQFPRA